jgi:hypothetical protein
MPTEAQLPGQHCPPGSSRQQRGKTKSSGPTAISSTTRSASTLQSWVDAVALISGERRLVERPLATGQYVRWAKTSYARRLDPCCKVTPFGKPVVSEVKMSR